MPTRNPESSRLSPSRRARSTTSSACCFVPRDERQFGNNVFALREQVDVRTRTFSPRYRGALVSQRRGYSSRLTRVEDEAVVQTIARVSVSNVRRIKTDPITTSCARTQARHSAKAENKIGAAWKAPRGYGPRGSLLVRECLLGSVVFRHFRVAP